jgi:hypothetical protein
MVWSCQQNVHERAHGLGLAPQLNSALSKISYGHMYILNLCPALNHFVHQATIITLLFAVLDGSAVSAN